MLLRRCMISVAGPPPTPNAPREPLALAELLAAQSESVLLNTSTDAGSGHAVVGDAGNVDAGERRAQLQGIHAANVVNHVVVSLHRAFRRIDSGEIDAVAVVAMDQVVMNVEIELIKAGGVCRAAARTCRAATNETAARGK